MDKLSEMERTSQKSEDNYSKRINRFLNSVKEEAQNKSALACDLVLFVIGFLLTRCHAVFGAHPIGIAFLSAMPFGVWPTLFGAAIGGISMGLNGVILAAATAIVVFLRAAVSSAEIKPGKAGVLFGESLLLRTSISILGGFITAVCEIIVSGFNESSILYGLSMIIIPPIVCSIFSGLFPSKISLGSLIDKSKELFNKPLEGGQLIFFRISALALFFFIGLSFRGVDIMGITVGYIYSGLVTLLIARRFGALLGMATGLASSIGLSFSFSISFALAGLCSGALFGFGNGYAIVVGGVALLAFSAYRNGLTGLLGVMPEYLLSSAALLPLLKSKEKEKEETPPTDEKASEDMVGTMALAYQNGYSGSVASLANTLLRLSGVIKSYSHAPGFLSTEEYREIVISVAEKYCIGCEGNRLCANEGIRPCIKKADEISEILAYGRRISPSDVNTSTEFCLLADRVAEEINRETARVEQANYVMQGRCTGAEEYELISKMLEDASRRDTEEMTVDNSMTAALTEAFRKCGFENGTIRVFGKRRRHFILAGEDSEGKRITSFELRRSIEEVAGVKLCAPEYFRKGSMALMECGIRRKLSVSIATASVPGSEREISGDTISTFETEDDYFYALISDGMGSGEVAKETSEFASEFIKSGVEIGGARDGLMYMLNRAIKERPEECSATIDLLELDLLNGQGVFTKSGAAPSFIKRDTSLFRIRSHTAPIGLMTSIDAERIKAEIKPGDHIIMMSDGVADESDDAAWLLLLLGEEAEKDLKKYAEKIINEARKNKQTRDDMSVIVIRVDGI